MEFHHTVISYWAIYYHIEEFQERYEDFQLSRISQSTSQVNHLYLYHEWQTLSMIKNLRDNLRLTGTEGVLHSSPNKA